MKFLYIYLILGLLLTSFTLSGQYNNLVIKSTDGEIVAAFPLGRSDFGLGAGNPKSGSIIFGDDGLEGLAVATDGCEPLINDVQDAIVVIDRGQCIYTDKAQNALDAGAVAAIICDNIPGGPLLSLGGSLANIWIPVLGMTYEDCQTLRMMETESLTGSVIYGNVEFYPYWFSGAPNYITPKSQVDIVPFMADVVNTSDIDLDNISFEVEVLKGNQTIYTANSGNIGPIKKDERIRNTVLHDFWNMIPEQGEYTINYSIQSTSIADLDEVNNTHTKKFEVSDNIYGKLSSDHASIGSFVYEKTELSYANGYYVPYGSGWRPTKLYTGFGTDLYSDLGFTTLKAEVREWQVDANQDDEVDYEEETKLIAVGEVYLDPENPIDLRQIEINLESVVGLEGFATSGHYLAIIHVLPAVPLNEPVQFGPLWSNHANFASGVTDFAFILSEFDSFARPNSMESCFVDGKWKLCNSWVLDSHYLGMEISDKMVSSTKNVHNQISLSTYPNPASEFLNLDFEFLSASDRVTIEIVNMKGKLVKRKEQHLLKDESLSLSLVDVPSGVYFVSAKTSQGSVSKKIIIQK